MTTYRNPKLLALAKHAPKCFCCGHENDGTVVGAHANTQEMGKGTGHKADDLVAYLCARCHDLVDGRDTTWEPRARKDEWYRAALLSLRWVITEHPEVFR